MKTFSDKQKLGESAASTPAMQEILKEVLQREGKLYRSETQMYIRKGTALKKE